MSGGLRLIAEEAGRLARRLPVSVVEEVADRLAAGACPDEVALRSQIAQSLPSPHHRALVVDFLDRWRRDAREIRPQSVAAALLTGARTAKDHRERRSTELVWTGPNAGIVPLRRTEQAILQVINSARERLLLVSFAVYSIPNIQEAVVHAASRGVRIAIVVETPNKLDVQNEYSTIQALGEQVAACSTLYYWPKENRKADASGKLGTLHVKCVVGDGNQLFLSSANLTRYAFTLNMELGVLITGGRAPGQVEALFEKLLQDHILITY